MVVSRGVIMLSLICKKNINTKHFSSINHLQEWNTPREGLLGSIFAEYAPLASQNPYPFIVYLVAHYRSHLSHFWENVIDIFFIKPFKYVSHPKMKNKKTSRKCMAPF